MASACVNNVTLPSTLSDPNPNDFIDFEFHLNSPVSMLTADELFSGGKLVPLHLTPIKPTLDPGPDHPLTTTEACNTEATRRPTARPDLIGSESDHFAVSPKAPTCSIRWRELLRLKRQQQQNPNPKPVKHHLFLTRNARSSLSDQNNLTHPLLKEPEAESVMSISSRLSLSSTPESDDSVASHLPRLSLDSEHKPNQNPILLNRNPPKNQNRVVSGGARTVPVTPQQSTALVDSPRMNASGKVVFQGLGRSSSSPSTCGAPRVKQHRGGMERSYSANVRVTPVLNVPVCSLRGGSKSFGFGQLFSGSGNNPKSVGGGGKK